MATIDENNETWKEILRTAWLVREADVSALGEPLALARAGMQEFDLDSLSPATHCISDAKILANLIDKLDKDLGGGGLDGEMAG